jgi:hypothetical protein
MWDQNMHHHNHDTAPTQNWVLFWGMCIRYKPSELYRYFVTHAVYKIYSENTFLEKAA